MLRFQGHIAYSANHRDNSLAWHFHYPLSFFGIQLSQLIIPSTTDYNEAIYLWAPAMCPGISEKQDARLACLQDHSPGLNLTLHSVRQPVLCGVIEMGYKTWESGAVYDKNLAVMEKDQLLHDKQKKVDL